ncbi:MAG: HpcH/HpaI aldolase/citrate lyase family protein, partial [Oscillospiraceae bacterium]|nr:HpcH/HpaI aldolase/citrate lyase family protein [Oscillospiraceae bacterium]MBR4655298.1 HpcH/HpaI aldolase/citrate lyase family protein [Oscillospiraceae bacterium]
MRHHMYNPDFVFVKEPEEFDKYTGRAMLQYCLGATMYMPGTKDFGEPIMKKKYPGLTSMVMCFEDACKEEDVPAAEINSIELLTFLNGELEAGRIAYADLPLIFFRVRNPEQFRHFSAMLRPEHVKLITGFNFPKFNTENGEAYMSHLEELNRKFGEIIYGMPIIEDSRVAFKETRMDELVGIKRILDSHRELVLNVRVGGTDFSSCFGVRRGIAYTIYDIMTVRDCLMDILNVFTRNNDYTVSGPVWEYFRASKGMKFSDELPEASFSLQDTLLKRAPIVNDAVDGLMRELVLDQANGFMGKTCIHPTHLNYINGMLAVVRDEYNDADQILNTSGGVIKGSKGMNEVAPHRRWAEKIMMRARAYGVIENESSYMKLFGAVK